MIQSIYSSVSDADTVSCGKRGTLIKSDPIPLLRDKFLGEYRTELEKAKVRKNLGIPDENSLSWGNIEGFVEQLKDLVEYVESKWNYTTDLNENVKNIKEAMDYALYFVTTFKGEHDSIVLILGLLVEINSTINSILSSVNNHTNDIALLELLTEQLNQAIQKVNEDLLSINVDDNILAWVENKLENSNTIKLNEEVLDLKISEKEYNAITINEGLYVKDCSIDVLQNQQKISEIEENLIGLSTYDTQLTDDTTVPVLVGGVLVGTTVSALRGKTMNQIIDSILFPTVVRDLVYPSVYYTHISDLVEVGSIVYRPDLIFNQNDAGAEISRTDTLSYNGLIVEITHYDNLGTYTYNGSVSYGSGNYLIDNKGNETDRRVEAGSLSASVSVTTTYPWYVDGVKQNLIRFGIQSGIQSFSSTGTTTVKLPGSNSTLLSFKADGGLGYLDIDLAGWSQTTELLNGITYKVWKKDPGYTAVLPHQINFKLEI